MRPTFVVVLVTLIFFACTSYCQVTNKRTIGISIAAPWVNSYNYYDYDLTKAKSITGFFGLGGAVYAKTDRNKISLNFGITGSLPAPIGPIDYAPEGARSAVGSIYVEAVDDVNIYRNFHIAAGINFINYIYNFISYEDSIAGYRKHDKTLGISIGPVYHFLHRFDIGVYYRPAIFSLSRKQYRHLISLSVSVDIDL